MPHSPPTIQDIEKIASVENVILRNLLITQAYHELSVFLANHIKGANWCSFAAWASKQAGQTIRKEDLHHQLEGLLKQHDKSAAALTLLIRVAEKLGVTTLEDLSQCSFGIIVQRVTSRASDAVSRGNKKVFEEIAFHFARFAEDCMEDESFNNATITAFCEGLRPGEPPEGQQWLRLAFTNYYNALFEKEAKLQTEICYLANLQIGFHEQTRLQPEIAEALNAAIANTQDTKIKLLDVILRNAGWLVKLRRFFQKIFGTSLLDNAVEAFILQIQECVRSLMTAHLMTLTMPPDSRLQLGRDLSFSYCAELEVINNPQLVSLLSEIDPLPGVQQSGAADWADLKERIHYIAELFRCYHAKPEIFNDVFMPEQVMALKQNKIPDGNL